MNHVYIDESGNTGKRGAFIIFASITTEDPRTVEKTIKKLWRAKPQFHVLGEFHAKEVDDATRKRILSQLAKLPITIRYSVIDKRRLTSPATDTYYLELANFTASHNDSTSKIIIDKKDTHKKRSSVIARLGIQRIFKDVTFEESHHIKQLQAVDFVAWSLGRLYEYGDTTYYDSIKHKESPSL